MTFNKISTNASMLARYAIFSLVALSLLAGCSKIVPKLDEVLPDRRTEYKKSKSLPDLEIPPDLTTDAIRDQMAIPTGGDTASYSTFQERKADRQRATELESAESSAIKVLENEHILAVEGVPVQIWPRLREFWSRLGYELELDDEELGVIETTWNENQEELIRDKFKIFAEPGQEPGTTLLYVSHRGEELVPQGDKLQWQGRKRDVPLERKLVERIQEELGGSSSGGGSDEYADSSNPGPAAAPVATERAELVSAGGGKVYLALSEAFEDAWKSTGQALASAGIEVDSEDRQKGVYRVRVQQGQAGEKKGMLSKLKFWGDGNAPLQVSLTGVGTKTEVVVLNEDGEWETGAIAGQLLTRLNRELNASAN